MEAIRAGQATSRGWSELAIDAIKAEPLDAEVIARDSQDVLAADLEHLKPFWDQERSQLGAVDTERIPADSLPFPRSGITAYPDVNAMCRPPAISLGLAANTTCVSCGRTRSPAVTISTSRSGPAN